MWIDTPPSKWVGAVELLGVILYLGTTARESSTCWSDGVNASYLPVVLLILVALAVHNGATQGARCGASLLWIVVPGIGIILLAGIGEWTASTAVKIHSTDPWTVVPLFLLPLLGNRTTGAGRKSKCYSVAVIGIVSLVITVLINGQELSAETVNAFYEYSKGITLFGIAERFEAVSACLLTVGWFALFSLLLGSIFEIAEEIKKGAGPWGVWAGVAAAIPIMYKLPINPSQVGIACVISWGILPLLTQAVERRKKSEKSNKNY